jgi:hypothetical protein
MPQLDLPHACRPIGRRKLGSECAGALALQPSSDGAERLGNQTCGQRSRYDIICASLAAFFHDPADHVGIDLLLAPPAGESLDERATRTYHRRRQRAGSGERLSIGT